MNNGASIINDISAGVYDSSMLDLASTLDVWMILNHTRGTPSTMTKLNSYSTSLIDEVCHELKERISLALSKGIYRWNIIADPGIGFAKSKDQNMSLIQNLDQFCSKIDFPTTLSFSEKKFLSTFIYYFLYKNYALTGTLYTGIQYYQEYQYKRGHQF